MSEKLMTEPASYPLAEFNRVKRKSDRGFYDYAMAHALLDAAMMCHMSYVSAKIRALSPRVCGE